MKLEPWLYALICSPICFTATVFNILFIFCLIRPVTGVKLRNPLRFLLIVVLCNSIIQQLDTALTIIIAFIKPPFWLPSVTKGLIFATFSGNFSCNAWISIFYYMSIVPQRHTLLVWIKRNIKAILYVGFILNEAVLLFSISLGTISFVLTGTVQINSTSLQVNTTAPAENSKGFSLLQLSNLVYLLYCICPMITLSVSWGKTFVYLRGHMKNMGKSSESFSKPQQKSQMRVTLTGMVQAALFLPSTLWTLAVALLYISDLYEIIDSNRFITMAFCSASSLGNVLCFGFSQSVFRKGIVSMFKSVKRASE